MKSKEDSLLCLQKLYNIIESLEPEHEIRWSFANNFVDSGHFLSRARYIIGDIQNLIVSKENTNIKTALAQSNLHRSLKELREKRIRSISALSALKANINIFETLIATVEELEKEIELISL